ncbi:CRISPR-associated protein Cas6 [Campylobacter sp. RM13119]|uniref:CRISPR-associated endoribonuclease Cas6 n=1 Tax=Campylobacter TaxID=194 RepID=UPI00147432DF|nr:MULTISPECIES: CRISPR-associated endoribonuclease Cas6 [unclassified Campylobacter]MBE3606911.1 CRISPR-associated protein Cas6 [Campylobacter sp. RM13119]
MVVIDSKLPTTNLKITKILPELIQGFIYHHLPASQHVGYKHEKTGKIFKKTNFDYRLKGADLRVRFTAFEPKFEELIAMAVLKNGLNLGEIHLTGSTVSLQRHRVDGADLATVLLKGNVVCALKGLLGHKVYLEPQDSRHLEMMKKNALERFETLCGREYEGEFELNLKWQNLESPLYFYYGNNKMPVRAWPAVWEVRASSEMINLMLDTGVGSGCMSFGVGFLEVAKDD